jgi:hypothetical protein
MSKGRRIRGGGRRQRGQHGPTPRIAGMISVAQDDGDDCPICLFIRARKDRARGDGMIPLDTAEVAELQRLMKR